MKILPWVKKAVERLEAVMFPFQESEFEQQSFTDVGKERVGEFLQTFDERAFNEGWDRLAQALIDRDLLPPTTKLTHPQWVKDRRAAYLAARR